MDIDHASDFELPTLNAKFRANFEVSHDNKHVLALRYLSLLALTMWVGGLLVLGGIAAPAASDVLGAADAAHGRLLAGAVFAETLRRIHLLSYACGAVVALSLLTRRILGPRPRPFAARFGIAVLMLGASAYSGVVSARVTHAAQEIGAAPSSLTEEDPRRAAFGRLHAISTSLELIPLAGGLILLLWELKD